MKPMQRARMLLMLCLCSYVTHPLPAHAQSTDSAPGAETRTDAWWTGPMLANSAETLPPGHFLIEPYLYDVSSTHADSFGSRTYVLYGLADRLTVGMIPIIGYNRVSHGPNSSGIQMGDLILQAQYRLTQFHEGSAMPTIAIQWQETLPTGAYDRLGNRPSNGVGSGTYTTTLGVNSQTYVWLPNGRILRMRLNVTQSFSHSTSVTGVSVYGTDAAFRGNAKPGSAFYADASWEYSLTQRWVLAMDAIYSHHHHTQVSGYEMLGIGSMQDASPVRFRSGSSTAFGFAPAIEYSWTPNLGVLLGSRFILGGHRTQASFTPAIALNYVH